MTAAAILRGVTSFGTFKDLFEEHSIPAGDLSARLREVQLIAEARAAKTEEEGLAIIKRGIRCGDRGSSRTASASSHFKNGAQGT